METYLDLLMQNHELISNSSDDKSITLEDLIIKQKGGDKLKHVATGSFPPIYMISPGENKKDEDIDKTRGFEKTKKTAVSIKEIMQGRRDDKKPFISL